MPIRLSPERVSRRTDPGSVPFRTTAELEPLARLVGQDRALNAIELALASRSRGFNVFCLGDNGVGKRKAVLAAVTPRAHAAPTPDDWCYVNSFQDPRRPRALRLPAGLGRSLRDDVAVMLGALAEEIPRAFGSQAYHAQRRARLERLDGFRRALFQKLAEAARERGVAMVETPQGLMLAPLHEGQVLAVEELAQAEPEAAEHFEEARQELETHIVARLQDVAAEAGRMREELRALNREVAGAAVVHLVQALLDRYGALAHVVAFLRALEGDLLDAVASILAGSGEQDPKEAVAEALADPEFRLRYSVNLLVDRAALSGAPVVEEANPTYGNLLGRVEQRFQANGTTADFTTLCAGALHRANGGYLLLNARDVLMRPLAWRALMRVLASGEIRIELPDDPAGPGVALVPDAIPLEVKVVLMGPPLLYYALHAQDAEFRELFKVKADFGQAIDRTPESELAYARFAATLAALEGLPHCDAGAMAVLVNEGARMAGEQDRLTARFGDVADLLREAVVHTRARGGELITAGDLNGAISARLERERGLESELQRQIEAGELIVKTDGREVGRVNGISVLQIGEHAFGRPLALAATVAMGTSGLIDIEREARMSGPIHAKGVLTLGAYLNRRYGASRPLAFNATLGFEQLYEEVEGDSASVAELLALISALAELPLRQDLAVTGAVNEVGDVLPVGGVTHKVEGFFDACRIQGLTGTQGVALPARSVRHLQLRDDVVHAVAEGWFHLFALDTLDDAIELLFERAAPEVHRAVEGRLDAFLEGWRALQQPRRPRTGRERRAEAVAQGAATQPSGRSRRKPARRKKRNAP